MPKNTTQKNSKGKNTTKAVKNNKAATSKKISTEKVETKVEVKEVVETKKGIVKSDKTSANTMVTKLMNNTPFVIALCVIIVLLAGLIFMLCFKRVPKSI